MSHSLLHQVLVSGLVVPVALAETDGQGSATRAGVRLGDDTWLHCDLVVYRKDQDGPGGRAGGSSCPVQGPPLLAVEVTTEVSRAADLGAKKALYERSGVPAYWVVDSRGDLSEIRVYELGDDGCYAERARLPRGRAAVLDRPFPIELAADQIFARLPRRPLPVPRRTISVPDHVSDQALVRKAGPDLPYSEEPILIDAFGRRWPTGAEKVELWDGCPVFYGAWDERDIEIAERAYPGRVVRLDQEPGEPGTMTVLPGPDPARRERNAARPGRARPAAPSQDATDFEDDLFEEDVLQAVKAHAKAL